MAQQTTAQTTAPDAVLVPLARAERRPPAWLTFLKRLITTKPVGAFGLFVVIAMILTAIFAAQIAPYEPAQPIGPRLSTPSADHWMGTDNSGRDIFSRVVYGARVAAAVGFGAVTISTIGALIVGITTGYFGGTVDAILQRFVDAIMALPGLVLLLAIVTITGSGLRQLVLILGFLGIAGTSRIVRSAVIGIRNVQYLEAARAVGANNLRVMTRHVLPNIFAPVMISATVGLGGVILAEAALSFLGLGISDPNQPTWGQMLSQARRFIETDFNYVLWPCLAITLAVFAFNMLGDALRDLLDPRLRGSR
jgi:peptide/nickel transport system permease protein